MENCINGSERGSGVSTPIEKLFIAQIYPYLQTYNSYCGQKIIWNRSWDNFLLHCEKFTSHWNQEIDFPAEKRTLSTPLVQLWVHTTYLYLLPLLYSITQSYAKSFWGDVVFDSFNNVSRDEDNILDQIYIKKMCSDFYHEDLKLWEWLQKMHI